MASAILLFSSTASAQTTLNSTLNETVYKSCDGGFVPYWGTEGETNLGLFFAYMLALFYFFGGVAVAADAFMGT